MNSNCCLCVVHKYGMYHVPFLSLIRIRLVSGYIHSGVQLPTLDPGPSTTIPSLFFLLFHMVIPLHSTPQKKSTDSHDSEKSPLQFQETPDPRPAPGLVRMMEQSTERIFLYNHHFKKTMNTNIFLLFFYLIFFL